MQIVSVDWLDPSMNFNGWRAAEDTIALCSNDCKTIGFLIEETKQEITISSCWNLSCNTFGGVIKIPRGCIQKIQILKGVKNV